MRSRVIVAEAAKDAAVVALLPFYEEHDLPVLRILTDRGTEFCGRLDTHD